MTLCTKLVCGVKVSEHVTISMTISVNCCNLNVCNITDRCGYPLQHYLVQFDSSIRIDLKFGGIIVNNYVIMM